MDGESTSHVVQDSQIARRIQGEFLSSGILKTNNLILFPVIGPEMGAVEG